jgi:hypothetical protein
MSYSLRNWLIAVAVLGGLSASSSPVCAQDVAEIDLEEITRRLNAWQSSFVNLQVVWELRSLPTAPQAPLSEWSPLADAGNARLFYRGEWIWANHGLDLLESLNIDRDGSRSRELRVFNGPKRLRFRASFKQPHEEAEMFTTLQVHNNLPTGRPTSWLARTPTKGLYWPGTGAWLPEKLVQWNWKLEGIEDIAGERCARIVAKQPEVTDVDWEILWLDLSHDCLIRRYFQPAIADRRMGGDFIVDELQQLESGIWFPKRGRNLIRRPGPLDFETHLWEVTQAAVNQRLDMARFEPPTPSVGTLVDAPGTPYAHGVRAPANRPGAETQAAGISPPSHPPARSAVPPTSGWVWWSGGLLILAFMFLLTGFWFWRRT